MKKEVEKKWYAYYKWATVLLLFGSGWDFAELINGEMSGLAVWFVFAFILVLDVLYFGMVELYASHYNIKPFFWRYLSKKMKKDYK